MNKIYCFFLIILSYSNNCKSQFKNIDNKCECIKSNKKTWHIAEINETCKPFLISGDKAFIQKNGLVNLIKNINLNSTIKIKLVNFKNKIPRIKIINSTYFTQKIGTRGVLHFLAKLVFNLTELKGVNNVYIDFIEGDHSSEPGIKNRAMFYNFFIICDR